MGDLEQQSADGPDVKADSLKGFVELSRRVMRLANEAIPRAEFLQQLSHLLLEFSDCDSVELVARGQVEYRARATAKPQREFVFNPSSGDAETRKVKLSQGGHSHVLRQLVLAELGATVEWSAPCFTRYGSFWTSDVRETMEQYHEMESGEQAPYADAVSMALIPFAIDEANVGLLRFECAEQGRFSYDRIESYEAVVETIGLAIAQRRAQAALRERVKELSCLYGIARVIETAAGNVSAALYRIVSLLPPAWQYPEIAVSRIVLDGTMYATADFEEVVARQSADIVVDKVRRGTVEVGYVEGVAYFPDNPFLEEESQLIQAVAREIGDFMERRQAAAERERLEEQLHHADRLATVGQLVAGVAHEINEPLGSILGFAQLALKGGDAVDNAVQDLNKIVASCLQAREIVNKLKIFARQTPIDRRWVSVADVVAEAISFVRGRCASQGIELIQQSEGEVYNTEADPIQLKQVIVNLAVNAVQAMPDGGTLTVRTGANQDGLFIEVTDTGPGMTEDVLKQIFNPFFTTKDVGEGTGLGLSVVHGIVNAHGGEIDVASVEGKGSKFTVHIPISGSAELDGVRR
jgi:signal transduction histidine kinase